MENRYRIYEGEELLATGTRKEIAEQTGCAIQTIDKFCKNGKMRKEPIEKIYALYRGENILALGTIDEIAETMNSTVRTIMFYQTESYKKRKFKIKRELIFVCWEDEID